MTTTIETFFEMLTYRRPMGSDTEERFIEKFLGPLGVERDEAGNLYKRIGESNVLWSSHTDTVHSMEGSQSLKISDHRVSLPEGSSSNCLGADCGTGVYIMTEMIKANKPGLYVFHRGEERGAHGSAFIAQQRTMLEDIQMAIAFDRYGVDSIITHQGGRCCSETFSRSVTEQIPYLKSDSGGIFTDTANYDHIVPECTNFSVGYYNHHTSREYQNIPYLVKFIEDMIALDTDKLAVARDPSFREPITYGSSKGYSAYSFHPWGGMMDDGYDDVFNADPREDDDQKMVALVRANPHDAMGLMKAYGITLEDFTEYCFATSGY